jgi:uncharacterized protein (DUF2252 family)
MIRAWERTPFRRTIRPGGHFAMTNPASGTFAARYEQGIRLRRRNPREKHADLRPAKRDPVAILAQADRTRVPELIPERYRRMLVSPFTFLRGAAALMARDLAHEPGAGIAVQAGGDCHLMNFGAFATPEEIILFDINDFDETLPGVDFTVDLKRLAASVAVAALDAGFSSKRAREAAQTTVEAYRMHMRVLAKLSPLEIWHSRMELAREIKEIDNPMLKRRLQSIIARAGKTVEQDDNFPHLVKGDKIADKRPKIYHFGKKGDPRERVNPKEVFASYRKRLPPERKCLLDRYTLRDTAFKAVGVGSVGTFCAVSLFTSGDGAPLFLQFKEAQRSVLECLGPKFDGHPGRRVVEGQRTMQAASDIFLGWTEDEVSGRHFYVRQLKNRLLGSISEFVEEKALVDYARLCGRTLARAHARAADPALIAGYMGKSATLDDALASFAMAYAARTQQDYDLLAKAKGEAKGEVKGKPKDGAARKA